MYICNVPAECNINIRCALLTYCHSATHICNVCVYSSVWGTRGFWSRIFDFLWFVILYILIILFSMRKTENLRIFLYFNPTAGGIWCSKLPVCFHFLRINFEKLYYCDGGMKSILNHFSSAMQAYSTYMSVCLSSTHFWLCCPFKVCWASHSHKRLSN